MSNLYSHLVWLGAGAVCEPTEILSNAKRITLYEAREAACNKLQQKLQPENINIIQALLTTTNSIENFTEYNLAEFSAIQPATGLKNLFPGIKAVNSDPINGTLISDAIHALQLTDANNLLIVDILDSNLALLAALEAAQQLQLFSTINVQSASENLYANSATSQEIIKFLQAYGYILQHITEDDPELPWLTFNLNPLWIELKTAQQTNLSLNAKLAQCQHQLNVSHQEAERELTAVKQQLIISQKEVLNSNQNLAHTNSELGKLRQDFESELLTQIKQLDIANLQVVASQEELDKQESYAIKINADLELSRRATHEAVEQLTITKQQLSACQKELATLKKNTDQDKLQLQEVTQNLEKKITELKHQLQTANEQILSTKQELKKYELVASEGKLKLVEAEKINQRTIEQLTTTRQQLKSSQEALTVSKQNAEHTKSELEKLRQILEQQLSNHKSEKETEKQLLTIKRQLEESDIEHSAQKQTNELLITELEKFKSETLRLKKSEQDQAKQLLKLQTELDQNNKHVWMHVDKISRLEKSNRELGEINAKLSKHQYALQNEMLKAEAQIDIIKELLLKQ